MERSMGTHNNCIRSSARHWIALRHMALLMLVGCQAVMASGNNSEAGSASTEAEPEVQSAAPASLVLGEHSWLLSVPRKLGELVGRDAQYTQEGLELFGSDLGYSF